jgi:N-acetylglutamate synthase-like GNAT family acetyltransferase
MTPVAAPLRVAVASGFSRKERIVSPAAIRKIVLQTATADDADAIHALITDHLAEGHLLSRTRDEILVRADRFVVARHGRRIVACAELAPLSRSVAEARSLVVSRAARNAGVGRRIIDELRRRAEAAGFEQLCAFTHAPAYFVHMGFSIVPHAWVPEKIMTDCHSCRHFRQCGQYAVVHRLGRSRHSCVPLTALHG